MEKGAIDNKALEEFRERLSARTSATSPAVSDAVVGTANTIFGAVSTALVVRLLDLKFWRATVVQPPLPQWVAPCVGHWFPHWSGFHPSFGGLSGRPDSPRSPGATPQATTHETLNKEA